MLSDNGTNFVAAEREFRELVEALDQKKKTNKQTKKQPTATKGVIWHFNPLLAPHFGEVHETKIKAAKRAVNAVLGNSDVTDKELVTALTGTEALLNSRALMYQSANPEDDVPLTPNHFLIGQVVGRFAPESVDETSYSLKKRRAQELVRHFWHRWLKEWIPRFNRGRCFIGLLEESSRCIKGKMAMYGVQVGKNQLTRPISKLRSLELQ